MNGQEKICDSHLLHFYIRHWIHVCFRGLSQKKLTTVSVIVTLRGGGVEAVTL